MSDLYLVWRNLVRKRLRFALTLFAIFIAFLIYGVLGSFRAAFVANADVNSDNRLVTVNKINFTQPLPIAYATRIRGMDGVSNVTWQSWFGGYFKDPKDFIAAFAVDPESYLDIYQSEFTVPAEQRAAFLANRQGAVVGEHLATKQGWKLGDRIPLRSNIYSRADGSSTWELVIEAIAVGKREDSRGESLWLHYDYLNEARSFGKDMANMIVWTATDPARNERLMQAVDEQFANSFNETQTGTASNFNKAFVAQLGNVALVIASVVSAAFFTILLIVGNTMMLAIRERTTEIAVLKTLGFRSGRIFSMVLGESMFLALLGGLAGLGLAAVTVSVLRMAASSVVPNMALTGAIALQSLGLMVALGLLTGLPPAWNAMRLNIVTALGRG